MAIPALIESRLLRRTSAGLGVLLLVLVAGRLALNVFLNRPSVRERWVPAVERRLEDSLGEAELEEHLTVEWRGCGRVGPLKLFSPSVPARPWVEVGAIRACPRLGALLVGKLELSSVTLERVRVRPGPRFAALRELMARSARPSREKKAPAEALPAALPSLALQDVVLELDLEDAPRSAGPLTFGPVDATVARRETARGRELVVTAELPGAGQARLRSALAPAGGASTAELSLEGLEASLIPGRLWALLPARPTEGRLSLELKAEARDQGRSGEMQLALHLHGLMLTGERLAPAPVGPFELSSRATLRWDLRRKVASLSEGRVCLGPATDVCVQLSAEVSGRGERWAHFRARAERLAFARMLEVLPEALRPGDELPMLDGTLGGRLELRGPLFHPAAWELTAGLDLADLKRAGRSSTVFLRGPFAYRPQSAAGPLREIWVGARNPSFVPFEELPPYLIKAVTTSEDAGFFAHPGFDFQEMKNSILSAAEAKRFRGASTLTQQLAKNLFLSRERTYVRKVREAWLTLMLEASLPKARLLEIYLNIIEWGPGLYGIGEAARHYFGVDARALSVKQAAFLATIIPNPIRYHGYFTRGALTETWEQRIADLLWKMHHVGALSDDDFEVAQGAPVVFRARAAP